MILRLINCLLSPTSHILKYNVTFLPPHPVSSCITGPDIKQRYCRVTVLVLISHQMWSFCTDTHSCPSLQRVINPLPLLTEILRAVRTSSSLVMKVKMMVCSAGWFCCWPILLTLKMAFWQPTTWRRWRTTWHLPTQASTMTCSRTLGTAAWNQSWTR